MAKLIRERKVSSRELVSAHLRQIERVNPDLNAVVEALGEEALAGADEADRKLAAGNPLGPLHGVPFSIKDSIDVEGHLTTAGTLGRKNAPPAARDATLVHRLREAGAIPIAKTNLPDLLFSFETDNLIFGRTNNPYDLARSPGGSSGGESALIAACGSPLGLGSDCLGSVRVPAHFCGICSLKPTSGRLPRTGHVPPAGFWFEKLWQIGPMARQVEDLVLAMRLLCGEDLGDVHSPPVPLFDLTEGRQLRIAFFTDNGIAECSPETRATVQRCAEFLSHNGMIVEEARPAVLDQTYELEFAILGADGADGIDAYLRDIGSREVHPLTTNFVDRMRPFRVTGSEFAARWMQWDQYCAEIARFFDQYDAILCPMYTKPALHHRESMLEENFRGFSYTMSWNVAGTPAATVRCGDTSGLPINVQVVAKPWRDLTALYICRLLESQFGGWRPIPSKQVA